MPRADQYHAQANKSYQASGSHVMDAAETAGAAVVDSFTNGMATAGMLVASAGSAVANSMSADYNRKVGNLMSAGATESQAHDIAWDSHYSVGGMP